MKIPENCLECDEGCYQIVAKPYESRGQDGNVVAVPNVKFLVCTDCGEELIPAESVRYISRFVAEANDQITKEELYAMLDATGLSQKDFAEAIGWERRQSTVGSRGLRWYCAQWDTISAR